MKIRDIMNTSVRSIEPTESIADAARIMAKDDIGALPVVESGKIVGMVTDRDLAVRGLAQGLHGGSPVLRVMSADITSCREDEDVEDLLERMGKQQVRRMPVCSAAGDLVGIVSIGDAARFDRDKDEVGDALGEISAPHGRHCQTPVAA